MTAKEGELRKDGFIGQRMTYIPGLIKKQILKDPRVSDLYITHIGFFPKAKGHFRNRPLGSSQHILLYCIQGRGQINISGKSIPLKANQLIIIEAKTSCSYGADSDDPWTLYWIHYTGRNAKLYSPPFNKIVNIPPEKDSRMEERFLLFEEMLQNMEDYFNPDKVIYANICLKLFLSSVKHIDVYRSVKKEKGNDLMEDIITYMKNNLNKNIRINDIAKEFGCSASNIYKLFKKDLNSAPIDLFIHLKMEKAYRYLSQTNLKIKEISHKLGYDDPYYFSRIFTKHTGMSPTMYRKEERS